jgi:hypothetical protein
MPVWLRRHSSVNAVFGNQTDCLRYLSTPDSCPVLCCITGHTGAVATNTMMERVPTVCVQARIPREVQPTGTASGAGAVAEATEGKLDMTFVEASVRGVRVND